MDPSSTLSCPLIQDDSSLVKWIYLLTGTCVYGNLSALSWLFGNISFVAWLGAQLPQVIENYANHSVDGLSWGFLLNWFIGDATNLLGCVLTHQLPFQTILALYYVVIDLILGSQYFYYSRGAYHRQIILKGKDLNDEVEWVADDSAQQVDPFSSSTSTAVAPHLVSSPIPITKKKSNRSLSSTSLKAMLTSSFMASFTKVRGAPMDHSTSSTLASSSSLATAITLYNKSFDSDTVGRISAWICAVMYLTSRMPQIYKNFCRKSTWGTSMLLFSAALTGNITYTLSIVLSPEARGANGYEFLLNELPFLIGSAGTVCFDVTILFQWYLYGNSRPLSTHPPSHRDHHQHHHHSHDDNQSIASSDPLQTNNTASSSTHNIHYRPPVQQPRHGERLIGNYDDIATDTTPLSLSLQSNYSA